MTITESRNLNLGLRAEGMIIVGDPTLMAANIRVLGSLAIAHYSRRNWHRRWWDIALLL